MSEFVKSFRQPHDGEMTTVPPMPIIVGVPRSGTTLLRLMLDAHSQIAIPPETDFIPAATGLVNPLSRLFYRRFILFAQSRNARKNLCEAFYRLVTGWHSWPDFHLSDEQFRTELSRLRPFTLSNGLRCFYRMYAARFDKPRWGDKTPKYGLHLNAIEHLLPESHFIHIIRDGRDVALSVKDLWFAPGKGVEAIAADWRRRILTAREQGRRCRRYLEIRYEDVVINSEKVLGDICRFIEVPFEPGMNEYYRRAPGRLDELETMHVKYEGRIVPKEDRLRWHRLTTAPPRFFAYLHLENRDESRRPIEVRSRERRFVT
ncbi:MAG TPA: sulfotransferase [Pyrinomonadaceae bacterium]|nr:sulfotransferase [Pyrinomonadaceae bacterium]